MPEILMPQMGESIAEGTLTKWFKKPGDRVKRDEPLFEISTDKVDAEVPAPADGYLEKILVQEGTTVAVHTVVGVLGESAGGAAAAGAPKSAPASTPPPASRPVAPLPVAAPAAARAQPATGTDSSNGGGAASGEGKTRSSPLVRRIARENGIEDLSRIAGTGAGGRVTKQDILDHIAGHGAAAERPAQSNTAQSNTAQSNTSAAAPGHAATALPRLGLPRGDVRVEKLTIMRKKIAEHMVASRRTSAHVHSVFEIDVDRIARLRDAKRGAFEARHGVKLTYTPFFMKAVVDALLKFPHVNASLDGDEILLHNSVHLGIAVALEGGLLVPVVRNAQELNLVGLQKRVTDLATRARTKQLTPDEVQGGTFTITNPGAFGNEFGIPIINQPQVAILGIGGVKKRAVVVEGDAIAVRSTVFMCLSYDHRLVDGALADQFMNAVKGSLEKWEQAVD